MKEHTKLKNKNNETIKAGCIVVNENNQVLLISESNGKIWTFPKGHAENDETIEQVALREVKEETGYSVEILKRLSDVTYVHGQTGELIRVAMFKAKPLIMGIVMEKGVQSKWFSIEEAKKILYYNFSFLLNEL